MESKPPPDYSVLSEGRLVAYVWRGEAGHLRRGGSMHTDQVVCEVGFGDIVSFEASRVDLLADLVARSSDLEAFLFKLQLEDLCIVEGEVTPGSHLRRF